MSTTQGHFDNEAQALIERQVEQAYASYLMFKVMVEDGTLFANPAGLDTVKTMHQAQLARALGISPNRIAEIVRKRRRISADSALRLGLFFGIGPEFWINLQTRYDLKLAQCSLSPEMAERIAAQRVA